MNLLPPEQTAGLIFSNCFWGYNVSLQLLQDTQSHFVRAVWVTTLKAKATSNTKCENICLSDVLHFVIVIVIVVNIVFIINMTISIIVIIS